MIRVANIIEEGRIGGPQRRIAMIASACANDIETTVILPIQDSKSFIDLLEDNSIKYVQMNFAPARKNLADILKYFFSYAPQVVWLTKQLKKGGYDLVHVSGGSWQTKGVLAAKLAKIPVVWHLNDSFMPKVIRVAFSFFSYIPVGFIFSSHRTREYYRDYIRGRHDYEIILPAPVDANLYKKIIRTNTDMIKKNLKGKLIIGSLANVNPIKGIETIIEIAKKLQKYEEKIEFVVVGAVHKNQVVYYNHLVSMCRDLEIKNLSFLGFTDKPGLVLNEIDIYVCTSLAESSPTSVWEAMVLAKPIVSFDVGDVLFQFRKANAGFVVPEGDLNGFVKGVERYIGNPKLRKTDGKKLQRSAIKELDICVITSSYINFCRSIVSFKCH